MLKLTLVLGLVACVGQIIGVPLTRPLSQESQNRLKAFKSMLEKSENAQKTQDKMTEAEKTEKTFRTFSETTLPSKALRKGDVGAGNAGDGPTEEPEQPEAGEAGESPVVSVGEEPPKTAKDQGIGSGMMSKLMDSITNQLSKGEPIKMVVDVKPQDVQRWLSPAEGEEPAQKETQAKKDQKDLKNPGGFRSGGCLPAGEWCEMSAPKCCSGNCYPSGCPIFANPTSCSAQCK